MSIFSKRLCLLHGIAMLFLLVFSSCEKDQFVPTDTTLASQSSSHEDLEAASSLVTLPSSLRVQLSSYVRKNVTEEKSAKMALDSLLEAILAQPARVFVDSNQVRNYASYVPTENPLHILNLVYATENGSLSHGYLHLFRMSPEFASEFNSFSASITDFVGEVSVYQISDLTKLAYAREEKNIDAEDCFTLVFSGPVAGPNGGGGANNNGETAGTTTGNPVGGGINWGTTPGYVGVIGGPGGTSTGPEGTSGGPGGTSGTTVSTGPNGGSTAPCGPDADNAEVIETYESGGSTFEVIRYQICNGGGTATTIREKQDQLISIESTNKNGVDTEDCIRLLSTVGIVPRRLVTPEMSELTHEQIEAAILETCFVPAVALSVIDPAAFELCYNGGTKGSTCVKDQVTGFLNDLFPEPINIPNSPLSFTISFDDVSHDHQSVFLNAAVAADRNEHTLAAIAYTRVNLSNPVIGNNLSEQIIFLSLLHKNTSSPEDFHNRATSYINLIQEATPEANTQSLEWLVENPTLIPTIENAIIEHPDIDVNHTISLISASIDPVRVAPNVINFHVSLIDKSLFIQLDPAVDIPVLTEFSDLFDEAIPGMADLYFGDYSSFSNSEAAAIPIAAFLKRIAIQGSISGLFDVGVQFGVEYFFGPGEDFDGAWANFQWKWRDTFVAILEGALPTKYGPYIGAAHGALEGVIQSYENGQDPSFSEIFNSTVLGAVRGYFFARVGDIAGTLASNIRRYDLSSTYQRLSGFFENQLPTLFRASQTLRKAWIRKAWSDEAAGLITPFTRGNNVEKMLSYGKYSNYNWTNLNGEAFGPVDFYLHSLAVQTKSVAKIDPNLNWANVRDNHVKKGMEQLERALSDGITDNGNLINFNTARLDICVPENMVQHIPAMNIRISNYITFKLQDYPNLAQLGTFSFELGTFLD